MELTGTVIAILEQRSGVSKAGKEWTSQEYVIEINSGQYPRRMCFNMFGADRINEAHIQMGETITVSFDIDAREWQGRWFTSINGYRVVRASQQTGAENFPPADQFPPQAPYSQAEPFNQQPAAQNSSTSDPADDLPF